MRTTIAKLLAYNCFDNDIWGCGTLTREEVQLCIDEARLEPRPWDREVLSVVEMPLSQARTFHASRVAYLVVNRDETPLGVDVGVPSLGFINHYVLDDGHHRLAAAIFRGDTFITIDAAGDTERILDMFGGHEPAEIRAEFQRMVDAVDLGEALTKALAPVVKRFVATRSLTLDEAGNSITKGEILDFDGTYLVNGLGHRIDKPGSEGMDAALRLGLLVPWVPRARY